MTTAPAVTLITAVAVPPDADAAFVADRERSGARPAAIGPGTLLRALRADVPLRFVELAPVGSAEAWQDGVAAPPFPAHAALYEVVGEDGEPEGAGGVLLIDPCEVAPDEDEQFLAAWERLRALFAARQGYLGTRMHRSLDPATFRYVAIVRWSSPLMYARALQQAEVEAATAALPRRGRPALYLPHA